MLIRYRWLLSILPNQFQQIHSSGIILYIFLNISAVLFPLDRFARFKNVVQTWRVHKHRIEFNAFAFQFTLDKYEEKKERILLKAIKFTASTKQKVKREHYIHFSSILLIIKLQRILSWKYLNKHPSNGL